MSKPFIVTIVRGAGEHLSEEPYHFQTDDQNERPMALDVLLQAQGTVMPNLAYRYGCRNALCGVCTIDINGKPKLACRTKLRNGDTLSALSSLPAVKDLVVNREHVNKQLRGKLAVRHSELNPRSSEDLASYQRLNQCIECYACLTGCPMHDKNDASFEYGNPYALLKIQQVRLDPRSSTQDRDSALTLAKELGMQECVSCKGCRCGVGIDLKKEVIKPLVDSYTKNEKHINQESDR